MTIRITSRKVDDAFSREALELGQTFKISDL